MPEQQNIEWKQSWWDEYLQWVSGFANADGGTIYIGKNDNGDIVGLSNYKKLLDELYPIKLGTRQVLFVT